MRVRVRVRVKVRVKVRGYLLVGIAQADKVGRHSRLGVCVRTVAQEVATW